MAEKREADGTEEWSDLEWQPPDETLDNVLVPIEGEKKIEGEDADPVEK